VKSNLTPPIVVTRKIFKKVIEGFFTVQKPLKPNQKKVVLEGGE
jgi:hypothetical protein